MMAGCVQVGHVSLEANIKFNVTLPQRAVPTNRMSEQPDRPITCLPCTVLVPLGYSACGRGTRPEPRRVQQLWSQPPMAPHHCLTSPSVCRMAAANMNSELFKTRHAEEGSRQPYMYRMSARPGPPQRDPKPPFYFPSKPCWLP
jgi:hypothetical protein